MQYGKWNRRGEAKGMLVLAGALTLALSLCEVAAAAGGFQPVDEEARSGSFYSREDDPAAWLRQATKDWMAGLPDSLRLSSVSIPGTHDSAARFGGIGAQTQTWTIREQLDSGIRYFDIRCRPTGSSFAIHHGAFFQNAMFGEVLRDMAAFLRAHPREVLLMRWRTNEHTPQKGSDSARSIADSYIRKFSRYFYRGGDRIPTLGQARGKIVVLRDGETDPRYGIGLWSRHTTVQDYWKVYWLAHRKTSGREWATLPSKKDQVKTHIDLASSTRKWVLNHLSGALGMTPRDVARATNRAAYEHLGKRNRKRSVGTVIMDFPGEKLVYRIIETNFASRPPAKVSYQVIVSTGDKRGAGTDANVWLRIYGTHGKTRAVRLNGLVGGNAFERGRTDIAFVTADDVGTVRKIEISHDNKYSGSAWYLSNVKVIKLGGRGGVQTKTAKCSAWLQGKQSSNRRTITAR